MSLATDPPANSASAFACCCTTCTDDDNLHWVQQQVAEVYPDPVTAAGKAMSVLSILSSESSVWDCKNQLMDLFEYEHFLLIHKFVKNYDVIMWCTKLMRSDADEHVNMEIAM